MAKKAGSKTKKADRGKILFVEDDKFLAEMFRQKFLFEGYKPIIAHTAVSAVLALRQEDPVAVVLDVVLPDYWDSLEYKKKAEQLKADAFIVKYATSPEKLVNIMKKLIDKYERNNKKNN